MIILTVPLSEKVKGSLETLMQSSTLYSQDLIILSSNYYIHTHDDTLKAQLESAILETNQSINQRLISADTELVRDVFSSISEIANQEASLIDDVVNLLEPYYSNLNYNIGKFTDAQQIPLGLRLMGELNAK